MLVELLTQRYPGMRLWLTQRLSALVMVSYIVMTMLLICIQQPDSYQTWRGFMSPWWWRFATVAVFICLVVHAWLGIRDVMRDYVKNLVIRSYLQLMMEAALAGYLLWLASILWNL